MQFLAISYHTQQQTQIYTLLSRRQSTLPCLDLHVVKVNKFFHLQTSRIGYILLNRFSFCIDIGHNNNILIRGFPKGISLLFCNLIRLHFDIGIRKSPALTHLFPFTLNINYWFKFVVWLNWEMKLDVKYSGNKNISFFVIQISLIRVGSAHFSAYSLRSLVERSIFPFSWLVLLLAFHSELLWNTQPLKQQPLFLLQLIDHHLLSFPFPQLLLQLLFFYMFKLF